MAASPTQREELLAGLKYGLLLGAAALALALPPAPPTGVQAAVVRPSNLPPDTTARPRTADFGDVTAPADVQHIAHWVARSGDNQGLAFVVLDKRHAHLYLFTPQARLQADTPVLLGSAPGDHTVAGVGQKAIHDVRPEERTTPAGRFLARTGRNTVQEDVVWVDYDAAVSLHRVRATDPRERRLERLASPSSEDNRISYGCINLPVAFFEEALWPAFRAGHGVVYVLPEQLPLEQVFAAAFPISVALR